MDDLYPINLNKSSNFSLRAAPELLSPYSSISIIITIPFSVPNYVPASVQIFSLRLSLRYPFPMLYANISKSFKYASINSIITLSLDTTL